MISYRVLSSRGGRHRRTTWRSRALACFAVLAMTFTILASSVAHASTSKEIDLSHWGLSSPSQIGFAAVSILHKKTGDELIIYDLRKQKPVVKEPASPRSKVPAFKGDYFLVSHFDQGNQNRLGGFFNGFAKSPSEASVAIENGALAFSYKRVPPTFAGFWVHLFNFRDPPSERYYMDSSPFSFLTFSIRGANGGEEITFQVADYAWEKKEDSVPIGGISEFVTDGKITTAWQKAWIPLDKFPPGLNKKDLAGLVFQVAGSGSGKIYIKDMAFTVKKGTPIPTSTYALKDLRTHALQKAMWLWETDKIINSPAKQRELQSFCKSQGITEIFVQIPYKTDQRPETIGNRPWKIIWDSSKIRPLVAALSGMGVRVHALDGDARFALREWHGRVIALINRIIEYNKEVPANERFVGIRYDNEPYLLPNFAGVQKEAVLSQYVELLKASKNLAASAGLVYGVDIPFWFDANNEFFEPVAELSGKPMSEVIIDVVDNIGIMDYRTMAYGADGVITHGLAELVYAAKKGKKVYIGLETVELPDETLYEFGRSGSGSALVIESLGGKKALISLMPGGGGGGGITLHQTRSVNVPASKITFADKPKTDLAKVMQEAGSEFSIFPSFYGFAIHSYESYKLWLTK